MLKKGTKKSWIPPFLWFWTKSNWVVFWAETHPLSKFHRNLLSGFCVILLTNQPTNQQTTKEHKWKHNLLGKGRSFIYCCIHENRQHHYENQLLTKEKWYYSLLLCTWILYKSKKKKKTTTSMFISTMAVTNFMYFYSALCTVWVLY